VLCAHTSSHMCANNIGAMVFRKSNFVSSVSSWAWVKRVPSEEGSGASVSIVPSSASSSNESKVGLGKVVGCPLPLRVFVVGRPEVQEGVTYPACSPPLRYRELLELLVGFLLGVTSGVLD
jgi:hypothetical protein